MIIRFSPSVRGDPELSGSMFASAVMSSVRFWRSDSVTGSDFPGIAQEVGDGVVPAAI